MGNVIKSRIEPQEIPAVSVTSFVMRHAERLADRPAMIEGLSGRVMTYGELNESIRCIAGGLVEMGFGRGDVLAMLSPNYPEYAAVFHGVALSGGTVTTINPAYTAPEICHQLQDAGARFLFTVPDAMPAVMEILDETSVEEIFVLGEADDYPVKPLSALHGAPISDADAPAIDPHEDIAVLPYSSGTTGLPKGVMLSHYNLVANIVQFESLEIGEGESIVAVLPLFHIYGMQAAMNNMLANGGTVITMPRFEMDKFLELHQTYKVGRAFVVPPILLGMARAPIVDDYDLSALKTVLSAAAPLGRELEAEASARLDCAIVQAYGLTETSPVTHLPLPGEPRPAGSIGVLVSNMECRIVDTENLMDVDEGESGEIWVRGPNVMKGYLGAPEATAATITQDGWLRTGDIGMVDENGYFFIVDRFKELIKYKGFQVAPAELEALLLTHPAVADAAVVPLPDEEAGEVPKAFVVMKPDADSSDQALEALMEYVAGEVATYKQIHHIEVIDAIPKSPSGKILRRLLRDRE